MRDIIWPLLSNRAKLDRLSPKAISTRGRELGLEPNAEHLKLFLGGAEKWNAWRKKHPGIRPNLAGANFNMRASASLHDWSGPEQPKSIFHQFLVEDYHGIDLSDANLTAAALRIIDFTDANLRGADLHEAEVRQGNLSNADLQNADLRNARFLVSDLRGTNLTGAKLGNTLFSFTAFDGARGMEYTEHDSPSHIDCLSIVHSKQIPATFLYKAGVNPNLLPLRSAAPHYTCFVSYSRRDEPFVQCVTDGLIARGVPTWYAPFDLGFYSEEELILHLVPFIDSAERALIFVSPNILSSSWVSKELTRALSREKKGRLMIIPMLLDNLPKVGSAEWNRLLNSADEKEDIVYGDRNVYGQNLVSILSRQPFDLRGSDRDGTLDARLDILANMLRK